jgi:hypothetical protein
MNKNAMVIIIICLLISWAILALLQKFTGPQITKSSASSSLEQKIKSVKPADIEKIRKMMGQ